MSPSSKYIPPSVEAIVESIEKESKVEIRSTDADKERMLGRRQEYVQEPAMTLIRTSSSRQRDTSRRSHRSTASSNASRNSNRVKTRASSSKHMTSILRDESSGSTESRHRHMRSHPSGESSTSSSSEEEVVEDHQNVLEAAAAARGRLTSPSLISTLTSSTTATNNSGSSSGSNSTVTQASMTKSLVPLELEPTPETPQTPISPAVPDPPDVFQFLDDSPDDEKEEEGEEEEEEEEEPQDEDEDPTPEARQEPQWLSEGIFDSSELSNRPSMPNHESMSSSGSSSLHSDEGSERLADNETDPSTSPGSSVKGEEDSSQPDTSTAAPIEPAASKLASQILAAQHRQSLHGAFQSFGTPQMARGNVAHSHIPSTALSPRLPQHMRPPSIPRADKTPVTGYDALASKLSNHGSRSSSIKPIYRKFERLNHRLLLHLQDELAELEEQLERLDSADTQSRSLFGTNGTDIRILPASRRAAAHAGGELEWHKMDLMNKISFKLGQYNQALTSFNKLTQELDPPHPDAVKKYRQYLNHEKVLMDNETKFLGVAGDLVALGRKNPAVPPPCEVEPQAASRKVRFSTDVATSTSTSASKLKLPTQPSTSSSSPVSTPSPNNPHLVAIAMAVAVSVVVPMMTFGVIPGFMGRMAVVLLVAIGVLAALALSEVVIVPERDLVRWGTEWAACGAVYGVGMGVVAVMSP